MKIFNVIIIVLTFTTGIFGQAENIDKKESDTTIYTLSDLDLKPKFNYIKGDSQFDKINEFIKENQIWPTQDDGIFIVYVKFVIEKNGKTSNVEIIKGVHQDYDKEAIRLINSMPIWTPGIIDDKYVRTEMLFPVKWTIFDN